MTSLPSLLSETPGLCFTSLLGLILGSFFNVVILRLPQGKSIVFTASHCPRCKKPLKWFHNVPVFSYLFLRGRCASCRTKISVQYPLVEIATAFIFGFTFYHFGFSWQWFSYTLLASMLLIISVIDLYHQIIPDELSLSGIVIGLLFAIFLPKEDPAHVVLWWESLLGILIGGGSFLAIALLYEKIAKREGLGGGDVKLNAMLGAWLGYQSLMVITLASTALGSIVGVAYMLVKGKDFKAAIPFGPFMAAGAIIYLLWGERLLMLLFPTLH